MREVIFGEYRTSSDWGLILNDKTINPPAPKIVKVPIDGRDGEINLSRALTGEIKYNNREASFTFLLTEGTQQDREDLITEIISVVHGNELKIVLPDKPDYYLLGDCIVSETSNTRAYGSITIVADCSPYMYSVTEKIRSMTVPGDEGEIVLVNNGKKTVVPTVEIEGSITLAFGTSRISLSSGTYQLPLLQLKSGNTIVNVTGAGSVTFTYREAVL